jgi:hypothetical protein
MYSMVGMPDGCLPQRQLAAARKAVTWLPGPRADVREPDGQYGNHAGQEIHVDVFQSVTMAALGASWCSALAGRFDSSDPQLSLKSITPEFI